MLKQENLEFNKMRITRSLKHKIIWYRKSVATTLVQLSQALGVVLLRYLIVPGANTNQFITAALMANRIGCQAWCVDQNQIPKKHFWKKLIQVAYAFLASAVSTYQLEVQMFQDELLNETKSPKAFDVLFTIFTMAVVEVGLRTVEEDHEAEHHVSMHALLQGMWVVFSQQSRLGIADVSLRDDPGHNTHAIQQVMMGAIPLMGYRVQHQIMRNTEGLSGVFNSLLSDQGQIETIAMKFAAFVLVLYIGSKVLEFHIFQIADYGTWFGKFQLLWHIAHGLPMKLMTETNYERVFFTVQQMNVHPIADGLNDAINEYLQTILDDGAVGTLFVGLYVFILLFYNEDLNAGTVVHTLMQMYDLGSSTGNGDFYYSIEYAWEMMILYYLLQFCVNFFYKKMAVLLDTFTAMMIRIKYDHDSRFYIENDREDEEQVFDEKNNGEDKNDFHNNTPDFRNTDDEGTQINDPANSNNGSQVNDPEISNNGSQVNDPANSKNRFKYRKNKNVNYKFKYKDSKKDNERVKVKIVKKLFRR